MSTNTYKAWLRVNNPKNPTREVWSGISAWLLIFGFFMYLSFAQSYWCLILVLYSLTAIHYWIKLAIGQWYYKLDVNEEKERKAIERESYNTAIVQLKTIHEELSKFLQRANETYYKDMKKVLPGVWIHKDFHNLTAALKWLNEIIDLPPVVDASIPKGSAQPHQTMPDSSTYIHTESGAFNETSPSVRVFNEILWIR